MRDRRRYGSTFWYVYGPDKPPGKGEKFPVTCPTCGVHTDAPIVSAFATAQSDFVRLPSSDMAVHNYLLRCTRCDSAMLVMWAYGEDYTGRGQSAGALVYPLPLGAFETERLPEDAIPKAIFEDLRQAELAYYAGADYGAGLLLRRACQYICRDKNAAGGNLEAQVDDLAKQGIITKQMAEMGHGIRIIGNELAHPDPRTPFVITSEDVRVAREFLTQLVRVIYIDPATVKRLQEDLKKRGVRGTKSGADDEQKPPDS